MSDLEVTYDAWKTAPEPAMREAARAVAPRVFDWLWNRIGASDYFDLLPEWYRDEVRAKHWSKTAVVANAGYPGCSFQNQTLRDLIHYNAHWVDQHIRGSLGNRHFNHDLEQAKIELELTCLAIEWLKGDGLI